MIFYKFEDDHMIFHKFEDDHMIFHKIDHNKVYNWLQVQLNWANTISLQFLLYVFICL
jgi:hypothetical protein